MANTYRIERWSSQFLPNPAMLRLTLANEGYTIYQWSLAPGMIEAQRKNETDHTHWLISGSLDVAVINAGVFRLEAGDRAYLPAGVIFSFRVIGEQPALYLVGEMPIKPEPKKRRRRKK